MKILLVGPDYEENLSIRYLSASLRNGGHDTILAPYNSPVDAPAVANAARRADLVGLSVCFQARAREFLGLAQRIKSDDPKKFVVAGGHYASCAAEPLLAHHPEIDVIVIHEGERTLVEIADAMPHLPGLLPEIPGIAYRDGPRVRFTKPRRMLDDLDALPFPDRLGPVHQIAGVPTSYLMGSRGCYGSCAYCCITTLHRLAPGERFRQRNVERIADEMSALYQERETRQFIFHDDNFLVPSEALNHARISGLEKALKQRGVRDIALVIKCRPADATPDILRRLRALGLIRVFLGVESATASGLSSLERDQTVDDSVRALEACAELEISAQFTLMTFNPDTTLDTLRADVAFMRRFSGNPLNFCRAEIYSGTPLERRMIESGRAKGDYRARAYRLLDPVTDLACDASLKLFHSRCWSGGSLMQNVIGLDHAASVVRHFYKGRQRQVLSGRVENWLRAVNLDTIDLLDEVIELCATAGGRTNSGFQTAIRAVTERESVTRLEFLSEAMKLRVDLQALRLPIKARQTSQAPLLWPRLVRPAAAALLAIGIPAAALDHPAFAQQSQSAPSPPAAQQDTGACSFVGRVIDPAGAAVPDTKIAIVNEGTGTVRNTTTDKGGQYIANDLAAGRYTVKAQQAGFRVAIRTGIVLKAGACERLDVGLTLELGCCEYVAVALDGPKEDRDLYARKKPFTYVIGDAKEHSTFQGIAALVYGDSKKWIQIFEANRDVVQKPGVIPYGTLVFIPPRKRLVPKLIFKVTPEYPPSARKQHIWGDVLMDVTLREDGAVEQTGVIDGHPLLVEAATSAVKQWRYRPLVEGSALVLKFVVAVSFSKGGKVR